MGYTQEVGARAERIAAEWLLEHKFAVLHMNWRSGRYEIDIVARRSGTLHFIEVKYRRAGSLTKPEEAITPSKFAALRKAAAEYITIHNVDLEIQFDVIAVESIDDNSGIRYIPNAMTSSW